MLKNPCRFKKFSMTNINLIWNVVHSRFSSVAPFFGMDVWMLNGAIYSMNLISNFSIFCNRSAIFKVETWNIAQFKLLLCCLTF